MSLEGRRSARLEDPGAELLDRAGNLWGRFGRVGAIVVGVIAVAVIGWFFTTRAGKASEEQAAGKLAEANLLFWQGDYPRSQQAAKQVYEQYANTPSGVDAHRIAGDDAFWQGNFKEAIAEYRRYLEKRKSGLIADAVRRSLAYALESDAAELERTGKHAEAVKELQEAATLYSGLVGAFDRESSAEFLAGAARAERLAGRTKEAEKDLQRLLDEFGETTYANQARMELAELAGAAR